MSNTKHFGCLRAAAAVTALVAGGCLPAAAANERQALTAGNEYMVVVNHPNNLNVLDLQSNSVLKSCALPGAFGPALTQISPDRKTAYVLNNRFGTIYGIELDSCKVSFQAELSQSPQERAKSIFSFAVSADGKEAYAVYNPTTLHSDSYEVGEPRFVVYDTSAGLDAKPIRSFPAPRQITIMQAAADGSLYMAGPNIYKVDVKTGKMDIALPIRDWQRLSYAPLDVLYVAGAEPDAGFHAALHHGQIHGREAGSSHRRVPVRLPQLSTCKPGPLKRDFAPLTETSTSPVRARPRIPTSCSGCCIAWRNTTSRRRSCSAPPSSSTPTTR
ncbi:MAG: quinohemoprotein amine dehydrogenase subunit beta [Rhodocyclaceae bacterium]